MFHRFPSTASPCAPAACRPPVHASEGRRCHSQGNALVLKEGHYVCRRVPVPLAVGGRPHVGTRATRAEPIAGLNGPGDHRTEGDKAQSERAGGGGGARPWFWVVCLRQRPLAPPITAPSDASGGLDVVLVVSTGPLGPDVK